MSDTLKDRLLRASVGACSCDIKSHEVKYHDDLCRYRLHFESHQEIEKLEADLTEAQKNSVKAIAMKHMEDVRRIVGDPRNYCIVSTSGEPTYNEKKS